MLSNPAPWWLVFICIFVVIILTAIGIYYVIKYEEDKK